MNIINTPPKASSLIESLRDIGYSLKAAVSDIVDNSISAFASSVEIHFNWDNEFSSIVIIDNGTGMSYDELIEAMRPGSISPLDIRDKNDLGRFGLGLKTASFSQCREVTVVSVKDGKASGCLWDLDYVADKNEWLLKVLEENEIQKQPYADKLKDSGTLVLWEKLDRVIDKTDSANTEANLYDKMDQVRKHMELVFHRYLTGEPGIKAVKIFINGDPLKAFDPFNSKHPATQHLQDERLDLHGEIIYIQPYILPHHSKISRKDFDYYAGEDGYLKSQGFYVYRNARLLISGTWFRLARQRELTRLARVKIDLPNSLDHLWAIDVKKSRARPPEVIRQRLKKIIERITGGSSRIYTKRGRRLTQKGLNTLWLREASHNKIKYSINRNHPLLKKYFSELNDSQRCHFSDILTLVEGQFPVDAFYADVSGTPESIIKNELENEKLLELADLFYRTLKEQSVGQSEIIKQFELTEPFRNNFDCIMEFLKTRWREDE